MILSARHVLDAVAMGVGASLLMDAWNLLLKRAAGIPSLDYGLVGRWFLHMPAGTFVHQRIAAAAPKGYERATGWIAHYSIGIGLALCFLVLAPGDWLARPTPWPALAYGLGTVVFPFFVLQPSLGLGIASAKAPHPARARLKSLATDAVFGVGLYLCGLALGAL